METFRLLKISVLLVHFFSIELNAQSCSNLIPYLHGSTNASYASLELQIKNTIWDSNRTVIVNTGGVCCGFKACFKLSSAKALIGRELEIEFPLPKLNIPLPLSKKKN